MPIINVYIPGVPRLGIPSIELVGLPELRRDLAREEKSLKLGFVNLIRDYEKTQVFGNFEKAPAVDSILGPDKILICSWFRKEVRKEFATMFVLNTILKTTSIVFPFNYRTF